MKMKIPYFFPSFAFLVSVQFFFSKSSFFMYDCYTLIYHALLRENYLSNSKDCLIMNHLILMVIFFKIYKRKLNDINPTLGFLW